MALIKKTMAKHLEESIGLSKKESMNFINSFFQEISSTLESGEEVKLSRFGHFVLRDKILRPGRNPKTSEHFDIFPRRVVTFTSSKILKDNIVNGSLEKLRHKK